jgi:hypothetical protein
VLDHGLRRAAAWSYRNGARWALLFAAAGLVTFWVVVKAPSTVGSSQPNEVALRA